MNYLGLTCQEFSSFNSRLFEYRAQCSFWHIPWMVGNSGVAIAGGIKSDFVGTSGLAIKLEAKLFESLDDFSVFETRQLTHVATWFTCAGLLRADYQWIIERLLEW